MKQGQDLFLYRGIHIDEHIASEVILRDPGCARFYQVLCLNLATTRAARDRRVLRNRWPHLWFARPGSSGYAETALND